MKNLIDFSNKFLEELVFLQGALQSMDTMHFFVYLIVLNKGL